jgi:hypothetical protein
MTIRPRGSGTDRLALVSIAAAVTGLAVGASSGREAPIDLLKCAQHVVAGHDGPPFGSLALEGEVLVTTATVAQWPRPITIRFLLPDHYLRVETQRTGSGEVQHLRGFSGARLLNAVRVSNPDQQQFGGSWGPEQLPVERRVAANMLLGITGWPTADVVALSSSGDKMTGGTVNTRIGDRAVRLELAKDCVPRAIAFEASVRLPPPSGTRTMPPETEATVRVQYDQRKRVGGLALPFRITTTANGVMLEQLTVARYLVNPGFTAKNFDQLTRPNGGAK